MIPSPVSVLNIDLRTSIAMLLLVIVFTLLSVIQIGSYSALAEEDWAVSRTSGEATRPAVIENSEIQY